MVTQTIKLIMSDKTLDEIRMVKGDTDRAISFEIYASEEATEPLDPTAWSFKLDIVKPDNTFVETSQNGSATFTLSAQAGAVTGKGYYQLFVYNQYDGLGVYTGQGDFRIDDDILNDDIIESVAEVNGLKFPEDFYTINDDIAEIDDTETTTEKTWSSSKIQSEIDDGISDAINDNISSDSTTWSSDKIAAEIAGATPEISDDFTLDVEKEIGTWLNGTTKLYRKVVEISGNKNVGYENIIYTLPSNCHIMMIDGCIYNDYWEGMGFPLNYTYAYSGGTYAFSTWTTNAEANAVMFRNYWNSVVTKIYLILYYTKS